MLVLSNVGPDIKCHLKAGVYITSPRYSLLQPNLTLIKPLYAQWNIINCHYKVLFRGADIK